MIPERGRPDFDHQHLIQSDIQFGYLDRETDAARQYHPQLVLNRDDNTMLRALRMELKRSASFLFSVAFVTPNALALLKQDLLDYRGDGTIVTSNYLRFNSPRAFRELLNLPNISVRLHPDAAFHPKGYLFTSGDTATAIMGSSNLTAPALVRNHEWNLRVSAAEGSDLGKQLQELVNAQLTESDPLTEEWVTEYEKTWLPPASREVQFAGIVETLRDESTSAGTGPVIPNRMQSDALVALSELRRHGKKKAMIVSATGTGKTILSALDVREFNPKRLLFIAHREQILDRAAKDYQRVLDAPASDFGKYVGSLRQVNNKYVFATVQTLSRQENLGGLDPHQFDYIIIDEVHRAGAATYKRIVDHFQPRFFLGMTATPERTDGINVFDMFDYNVPYEIRLNRALEEDMLAPFHYYGVTDYTDAEGRTTEDVTDLGKLVSSERVDYLLDVLHQYAQAGVQPRGLIFCSRKEEAHELSRLLNSRQLHGKQLRTIALTGDDDIQSRERAVDQLESGLLDYILTVDIFNEGVDIPTLNQVVMLRQTKSAIVFVQQLGRGLRKAKGKDYVVVIDFIGNYTNNFLIPIALFGDESLNKESLRKNLLDARDAGVLAGLSSVQFDEISQQRVLASVSSTALDSFRNLKSALENMQARLGRTPRLHDFARFESVDPVLLATREGNYPTLLRRALQISPDLTDAQLHMLTMLSHEQLAARRLAETLVVQVLIETIDSGGSSISLPDLVARVGALSPDTSIDSVHSALHVLSLGFGTQSERKKFGIPLVTAADDRVEISPEFRESMLSGVRFREEVSDLVKTGYSIVSETYDERKPFIPGLQYSRRDSAKLLNWSSNSSSVIYGYKVDDTTMTCPIFVTYHKQDTISASTAYEDELLDRQTMLWYSKSKRTLASGDVKKILSGEVDLHVFAKKDDSDGSDFFYLGQAEANDPEQTTMRDDKGADLPVVRMHLKFAEPIESSVFHYFAG